MDKMCIIDNQKKEIIELTEIYRNMGVDMAQIPNLNEEDIVLNEAKLQKYTNYIRGAWIKKTVDITADFNRAPWRGQLPIDIYNENLEFTYENLIDDQKVARRFAYKNDFNDRITKTFLYNNGMAAIRGTLDIIDTFIKERICIKKSVGYFETRIYLESLVNRGILSSEFDEGSRNNYNVFIFEPIKYLLNLEVTNLQKLIHDINISSSKIIFVIMDSTMHNYNKLLLNIEKNLLRKKNVIFIDIRSGIKMDQLGLEIANFGVATWYVHVENIKYAEFLFSFIGQYKGLVGDNISYNRLVSLELFSAIEAEQYALRIRNQVLDFLKEIEIKSNRYIKSIDYPSLKYEQGELCMPFLFIKFNLECKHEYEQLLDNIVYVCELYGVFLPYRNSFGFRYPSIEYICDYKTEELVIKLCLGVYKGALYYLLLQIINDLGKDNPSEIKKIVSKNIERWD